MYKGEVVKKVIFVSSSGGHLSELLMLEDLFYEYDYLLVTESTDVTSKLIDKYNMEFLKYGPSKNIFKYLYNVLYNIFKSFKIVKKIRPETVVTTGAQVGGIFAFISKLYGSKIIYIESIARVNTLSITAKVIYHFANKFYVQWEKLAMKYKKAQYLGRLM